MGSVRRRAKGRTMRALHPSDMLMTLSGAPGASWPLRIVCRCDTNALP